MNTVQFEVFWSLYPRRVGKLDALKAWNQMTRQYDPEAILEGAKRFAREPHPESQFIPYPASWLRAGRWMDGDLRETIRPEPMFRAARTVDELKAFYESAGKTITPEIARARSVEDLPAFARMVPKDWNVSPMKRTG